MTDTEKAISLLQQCLDERPYAAVRVSQIMSCIQEAVELLKEQETIVRCKDCKYYRYYGPDSYIYSECTIGMTDGPIPTWFCAGGERK